MKDKTDPLFQLIKMLTPAEKIRIKQFAGLYKGDQNHIQLYDLLSEMEFYDEAHIRKHFKGKKMLNNLSRVKNYLFQFILKALSAFYTESNADLSDLIRQINILLAKNSFDKGLELISKAKKIAAKRERFHEWLQLLNIERKLTLTLPKIKDFDERLDHLKSEIRKVTERLNNLQEYENLENDLLKKARRKYQIRGEKDKTSINNLARHPLMQNSTQALSSKAKIKFFKNISAMAWMNQDIDKTIESCQKIIEICETSPEILPEVYEVFFAELLQLTSLYLIRNNQKMSLLYLNKMEDFSHQFKKERTKYFDQLIIAKLTYALGTADFDIGNKAVEQVRRELKDYINYLKDESLLFIYFLIVKFFLLQNDLSNAFKWVQKILQMNNTYVRIDLHIFARVMHLIILFEQEDWKGLESHSRNYSRFINQQEQVYKVERSLVNFFRKHRSEDLVQI